MSQVRNRGKLLQLIHSPCRFSPNLLYTKCRLTQFLINHLFITHERMDVHTHARTHARTQDTINVKISRITPVTFPRMFCCHYFELKKKKTKRKIARLIEQ